jgi:hypothetical protein
VNSCPSGRRRLERLAYTGTSIVKERAQLLKGRETSRPSNARRIRRSPDAARVYGLGNGRDGKPAKEPKAEQDGACSSYTVNTVF